MLRQLRNNSRFAALVLLVLAATLMVSFCGCTLAANNSLRALAQKRGIPVEPTVTMQALPNDSTDRTVLAREFNIVTPDNEMKFLWVHPECVKLSLSPLAKRLWRS
jgi:GH35 family endo-1,4-beta-xylanase